MKRVLCALLVMLTLVGTVFPACADVTITSSAYREVFVQGYSWSTGKPTGTTHGFQVYFKNSGKKSIYKYRVYMRFYNSKGELLDTKTGDWVKERVKSGKTAWTPVVTYDRSAVSFTWRLGYCLNGSSNELLTGWKNVATPDANEYLIQCRSEKATTTSVVPVTVTANVKKTSYQLKYEFEVDINGKVIAKQYFRNYIKNSGKKAIVKYREFVSYRTAGGHIRIKYSDKEKLRIKKGASGWLGWVEIPAGA